MATTAERQHGVLSRGDLEKVGCTASQVRYLVKCRRLVALAHGVYRIAGTVSTWRQRLYAATAAAGTWAAASHRSAAMLWALPGGTEDVVEIVCSRRRRKGTPGAYAHETYLYDPLDFTELDGIAVTSVTRTLCDLGVSVRLRHISGETLVKAIEDAIRRGLTSPERLRATWERLGGSRRPGASEVMAALDHFLPQTARSDTMAEQELVRILVDAGHDDVVTQHHVVMPDRRDAFLDTYIPSLRIAPEFDSYRYHGGRVAHDRDGARTIKLAALGIVRLAVTDAELDAGCPNLLYALAQRRAATAPRAP